MATTTSSTTTTSTTGAGTISFPGIGTSIDVATLVTNLMNVESQPLTLLQNSQTSYQAQLSAVGTLKSALSTFQSSLSSLTSLSGFTAMKASGYDTSILNASVTSSAPSGTYAVNVTQLAQSQVLAAQGQTSTTAAIGSGTSTTISFQFGTVSGGTLSNGQYSGATFTQNGNLSGGSITINSSNNTLAGIRDAINSANLGVSASIVNDGSSTPNRLVLTSTAGGSSSEMKISVSGDSTLASLLSNDPAGTQNMSEVTTGQNAQATINGIAVQSPTNTLSNVVDGTSLTLSKTGSTTVSVANDASATSAGVVSFVKAYNALRISLNSLTNIDTSNSANNGPLASDVSTKTLVNQITDVLGQAIGSGTYQSLGSIGVTMGSDGTLSIDDTKLSAAIAASPSQVAGLFAGAGTATDALVSVPSFTDSTQAGTYAVNVTQLATQGSLTGSAAANTTITQGVNDTLAITVSNITTNITVPAGSYTASSLAAQVQSQLNASTGLQNAGITASVSANASGVLTFTSSQYGSTSNVSISGNGASSLVGSSPTSVTGQDVQGTINGVAATGSGQNLYGATGTAVDGLTVKVAGGSVGSRGTVSVQRGYAAQLNTVMTSLLSSTGMVQNETDSINSSLTSLASRISTMQTQLNAKQALYYTQFNTLSALVASMTNTSTYLTTQLAAIAKQTSSSSN
ncbi:flagellar filament capping protein FliD [Ralstonia solanacearum]|uniref:Flagellar hook-associated protein 2 n=1 Tax=Ralstonia solanacearum TaxID=305 RepID=A0AAW5ZTT7_RALSL|nr:flagellar filament capping protein FliD [Ralstonia solanacearum]AST34348.2 flagellar filament capping protein FliD [Ralstonia solanacearum]MDB0510332.1 flagellar filament capping protein FliD [Ralstonia solanacearum]MDB0568843.1 flagellar filament capping protein FliD [Ralstonia solanacearum]MDB0572655.1 flagellar filament capping protein FliD [Ralstonia solanacearum]MDB0578679.1 flagellar filament capping protein FliD [Ralstonia solanacearum]